MKIRTGFVSNSSTSSFVICGYKISGNISYQDIIQKILGITRDNIIDEMKKDYYKDKNIDEKDIEDHCSEWLYDIKNEQDDIDIFMGEGIDGIIFGIMLAYGDDIEDMKDREIDLTEMLKKLDKIRDRLELGDSIIKIFTGTAQC